MNSTRIFEVQVHSFLERSKELVCAQAEFGRLFEGFVSHAGSLGPLPSGKVLEWMRQCLAAASLHLSLLPKDQYCGWTLNLTSPRTNIFLAGDNSEFQITGRIHNQHVKTQTSNRLFIESCRPKHKATRGIVEFKGDDILQAFERYYASSIQLKARLFELEPNRFFLLQGLPRAEKNCLKNMALNEAQELAKQPLEPIEDRTYRFQCGCNKKKIMQILRSMFQKKPEDLFQGDKEVETQCPRCGRNWLINRLEFDRR
jgi:molecular chaperone Hsp33